MLNYFLCSHKRLTSPQAFSLTYISRHLSLQSSPCTTYPLVACTLTRMKCYLHSLRYGHHKRIKFGTWYHYSKGAPWHDTPVFPGFPCFVYVRAFPAFSSTGAFYVQISCPSEFLIPHCSKFVAVLHKLLQDQANNSREKKKKLN